MKSCLRAFCLHRKLPLSPIIRLVVSRHAQELYVAFEGHSKEELSAEPETKFYAQGIIAYSTFSGDSKGGHQRNGVCDWRANDHRQKR